jgi:hypothetical protein
MQMLRASGTPWLRHVAIGLVIAGLGIAGPDALAEPIDTVPPAPGVMPLAPGPGCGAQGGAHPAVPAALRPALVRADRVKPRRSKRAVPAAPAPVPPPEPPAVVLHAFYACATLPLPTGPGWVAVGPLRRARAPVARFASGPAGCRRRGPAHRLDR